MNVRGLTNFSEFRQKVCHDCVMQQEKMKQMSKFMRRSLKQAMHLCLSIGFLICLPSARKVRVSNSVNTLVIDAGHGGLDPGCNGNNEILRKMSPWVWR